MEAPSEIVAAVERIIVGGVAITARALAECAANLTLHQWRVLVIVGEHDAGLSVGQIGQRVGASPPSASRLLRRLEDQGLIALVRDDADRRYMLVHLTATGRTTRTTLMERRRELIRQALSAGELSLTADAAGALALIAEALVAGA